MSVFVNKKTGERVQPSAGSRYEKMLRASADWQQESESQQAARPAQPSSSSTSGQGG